MPIYEYEPAEGNPGCAVCKGAFELRRSIDRPELEKCPACRRPVRRVISRVHSPKVLKPLSVSDAKAAGFTVFEKRDKGVYERQ